MWHVLYVEDDADSREIVEIFLKGDSDELEVRSANTVEQAVDSIRRCPADLYLLDAKLPDGDGVELCRWIRSCDPRKPIAFLSGNAFDLDKRTAAAAGCDVYLTKPLDLVELRKEILRLLRSQNPATLSQISRN